MWGLQNEKIILQLILVIAVGVAAGCAPQAVPTPAATEAPPTATAEPIPTPIPLPTDTPFVPKGTVKIASEAPDAYDIGVAAERAVHDLSGPLNDLGYDVQLVQYNDRDDVDDAISIAREIIADSAVLCGVGPLSSRVALNVSDLYHIEKLAFVSPSATQPKVTDRKYPEMNRVAGRNDVMGAAAARFAAEQGFTKAYLVMDDGDFASQAGGAFRAEASKVGLGVIREMRATVERGNLEAVAELVKADQPEFVFFSGFTWQASPFFKAVREAGYKGVLFTLEPNPDLAESAGPLALDGDMYYVTSVARVDPSGPAGQFIQDFRGLNGRLPGPFALEAYDATGVCLKAIEDAIVAKDGELPTRAEVAAAVRAIKDYAGITGTFSFDKKGDRVPALYLIHQVEFRDPSEWGQNPVVMTLELSPP